jgi:hypothetical protein
MEIELQEIRPVDICLGNFFDSMGKVEMVTEIVLQGDGSWFIGHRAWNQKNNPIPESIQYSPFPLVLTEQWKKCLGIDKYEGLPERIIYVHEAQNYMRFCLGIDLLESINWDMLPTKAV